MDSSTTGRDAILCIAKGFDDDGDGDYTKRLLGLKLHDPELLKFLKRSRELEKTLEQKSFPVAPFVVRSKIGRQKRQIILNRLMAQHIVCLAQNNEALMQDIQKDVGEAGGIIEQARKKAIHQEDTVFKSCRTNQEYHTKSVNVTAIDWYRTEAMASSTAQTSKSVPSLVQDKEGKSSREEPKGINGKRKDRSFLVDSDIDWENGVRDSDAMKMGFRKRLKPVVIELVEKAIPNSIPAEMKVKLVKGIMSDAESELLKNGAYVSSEKMKEKLKPFVRKATETISFSQSIYYTT